LNPVGVGEVGEICIAGPGVSPGYHHRPELNAEKFCRDPFHPETGELLYRSGDLGRFLPNGRIQFVARKDQQLKLRGFRIEPGEIESQLLRSPAIRDCVVVLREDAAAQPRLVAFVVVAPESIARFRAVEHLDRLRTELPPYMIPSLLVPVCELPVTVNKKIDRQRLATAPLAEFSVPAESETPPQMINTEPGIVQRTLVAITAAILGVAPHTINPDSHFGELGLDSIQLTRLAWQIKSKLGVRVEVTALYKHPTPRRLAESLFFKKPESQFTPSTTAESATAVAIVGMAVRVAGASDLSSFWQLLVKGESQIRPAPPEREFPEPWRGGYLDHIDEFDAAFFGISDDEAALLDPQQRLLLQACWHALEDAGERPSFLAGSSVGVFVGMPAAEYQDILARHGKGPDGFALNSLTGSVAANRVSWTFNFNGPSEVIDTGCSSSLIAVHRAAEALRKGECTVALAAGINLLLTPDRFESLAASGILSPDGVCRPFSADGNGLVRGEGLGVVVLKSVAAAQRDANRIDALVLGSAVSHGGRTTSLAGPNPAGQSATIQAALRTANIGPDSVSYVELQGSGVPIGDRYEWAALRDVFERPGLTKRFAGTSKPLIGHLECAAGIVSLIKVVLALRHEVIPGVSGVTTLQPEIEEDASRFALALHQQLWPVSDRAPRCAGVHGFGYGGTIAHIVLKEAPVLPFRAQENDCVELVLVSARSAESLRENASLLIKFLHDSPTSTLADIAFTLLAGRDGHSHRLAFVVHSREELIAQLEQYTGAGTAAYLGLANHTALAQTFFEDPEAAALLRSWIARRRWPQLAGLWVQGVAIPWHEFPAEGRRVASLPPYAFERRRHWFSNTQNASPLSQGDALTASILKLLPGTVQNLTDETNLVSLGADSLGIVRLLRSLTADGGRRVSLSDFLIEPTLGRLRRLLAPVNKQAEPFGLSRIQQLFSQYERLHPGTTAWHSPFAFWLRPEIDVAILAKAIEAIVHRYSILRSIMTLEGESPQQTVAPPEPFELSVYQTANADWQSLLRTEVRQPFDSQPVRAAVFELPSNRRALVITLHHRVLDGVSSKLLFEHIQSAYQTLASKQPVDLPADEPYCHFVDWESKWLATPEAEQCRQWWHHQLPDGIPKLPISFDLDPSISSGSEPASFAHDFSSVEWKQITDRCRYLGITASAACLAAWALLLTHHAERPDIVLMTPVAGRPLPQWADAIGAYLNLVPLRVCVSVEATLLELCQQVTAELSKALDHATLPLLDIRAAITDKAAGVESGLRPGFYGQTWTETNSDSFLGEPIYEIMQEGEIDLALEILPHSAGCRVRVKYSPEALAAKKAERLLDQFMALLDAALAQPHLATGEITFLSPAERQLVLEAWNATSVNFPLNEQVQDRRRSP
jgi:3-oxoacyl-(acyl-carrier-protein) synthase/aryl carrier-like protein